jgi:hypothetical protein
MATESIRELWRGLYREKGSEVEQSSNQSQQHERRYTTKRLHVQVSNYP